MTFKLPPITQSIANLAKQAALDAQQERVPIAHAGRWRNLMFCKDGSSYWGTFLHATEEDARRKSAEVEYRMSVGLCNAYLTLCGKTIPAKYYSHAIPMPVK